MLNLSTVTDDLDIATKEYADTKASLSHTHAAADVTSGTFASARIPSLAASKITSGTLATARGGVPTGGSTGQVLAKKSNTNNDLEWVDQSGGGGGGGGVSIIKLWENPSISSSFSAQTITVSGSWDAYIISFIPRTDYGAHVSVAFPADGVTRSFGAPYGSTNCYRTVTCNSGSLVFDGGYSSSSCGIPTCIWGIKYASGDPTVLGDFVVERGETDGWKWKKWNSGDIECWTRKTHSIVISDKYGNGWYSGELYETIPSGLLTQVDSCVISGFSGSGAGYSVEFGGGLTTTRTQSFWLLRVEGASGQLTADISVDIKGKWK